MVCKFDQKECIIKVVMSKNAEKKRFSRNLAVLIREARLNADLKQEELSDKLNVSPSTVSAWERGTITPNFYNTVKVARCLELSLDDMAEECL